MSIFAREPETKFTPAPEGLFLAACCDVVDLGTLDDGFGEKPKVEVWWQIDERNPETGKRFAVRKRYTLSLHEKATLRKELEMWRGQKFTKEQLAGFDLETLVGVSCQVQTIHKVTDDGKVYCNVAAVVTARGQKLTVEGFTRHKDREQAHGLGGDTKTNAEVEDDFGVPF